MTKMIVLAFALTAAAQQPEEAPRPRPTSCSVGDMYLAPPGAKEQGVWICSSPDRWNRVSPDESVLIRKSVSREEFANPQPEKSYVWAFLLAVLIVGVLAILAAAFVVSGWTQGDD
jgi:hypothetical protein